MRDDTAETDDALLVTGTLADDLDALLATLTPEERAEVEQAGARLDLAIERWHRHRAIARRYFDQAQHYMRVTVRMRASAREG